MTKYPYAIMEEVFSTVNKIFKNEYKSPDLQKNINVLISTE